MNGREGIDMAKMAVSVLLCSLLVGTVVTFFYVFVTIGNKSYGDTKQKVETVNMEKLYTMQDQSLTADNLTIGSTKAHPLVSAAASTLLEYDEKDLIYIYVTCRYVKPDGTFAYRGSHLFTYTGVAFTPGVLNVLPGYSAGIQYSYKDTILNETAKYLNQWAKERCHLSVGQVPVGSDTLTGICIEVLEE